MYFQTTGLFPVLTVPVAAPVLSCSLQVEYVGLEVCHRKFQNLDWVFSVL